MNFSAVQQGSVCATCSAVRFGEYGAEGMCGPKADEVTGEWRKLHHEKLNL